MTKSYMGVGINYENGLYRPLVNPNIESTRIIDVRIWIETVWLTLVERDRMFSAFASFIRPTRFNLSPFLFKLITMERLTKTQIINETVEFYSAYPQRRGSDIGGNCMFQTRNQEGVLVNCAVGRCMTYDALNEFDEAKGASVKDFKYVDGFLQDQYKGHENEFWYDLQQFHDGDDNWSDIGFTPQGELAVENLLKKYQNQ